MSMKNHQCKLFSALAMIAGLSALAGWAAAQGPPPTPLSVHHLKDNIYWTEGGAGGNTGFIVGQNGVIVFDAKTTPDSAREMLAEIAKITPKPVTHVIISHSDGDHVNGLAGFPKGLAIIAQENCKKEMIASKDSRFPAPQDYLPTQTFDKKVDLTIDGVKVQLFHWVPAHTSGDTVMYLPDAKIAFGGDMVDLTQFALIHAQKGGNSEGWIETMKGIIAIGADTYVSGHGGLQTKATLQERLAAVEARRAKVKEMVAQGKSLDEAKATAGALEAPHAGAPPFPPFTEVVYLELTKKN
jgi:glyoxylase-like metal-dependent hydrolase (beta-lactamase superfamily II)